MTLIETYYRDNFATFVKRMARRLDNNEADAKDVVQNAFTRALMSDSFSPDEGAFGAWFNTILFRSLSDFKRTKSGMSDEDHEIPEDIALVDDEELYALRDFVVKVKPHVTTAKTSEVYDLFFMNDFTTQDIAYLTGKTDSAIRMTVSRLRNAIKNWNEAQVVSVA